MKCIGLRVKFNLNQDLNQCELHGYLNNHHKTLLVNQSCLSYLLIVSFFNLFVKLINYYDFIYLNKKNDQLINGDVLIVKQNHLEAQVN